MVDDLFNTLPMRRFLKKCVDLYKEAPMGQTPEPDHNEQVWYNGKWIDQKDAPENLIICPYCKNSGQHLCPDVSTPVLIKCTHKQCPVTLLEDNKRMFTALANDGRFSEDMDRIRQLEFAIDRFRHHVGWARTQDNLTSAHNCLSTAWTVLEDILTGKTPVPDEERFPGLKV